MRECGATNDDETVNTILKVIELKSHDWLEDAILTVCKKVFPLEPALEVHSISNREQRFFAHRDYDFYLSSPDAEFHLVLRMYYGMFSVWSGTEDIKTAKEFSVMRHTYQHGFPSPFPYCFSTRERPFGRAYVIMDAGDGHFWWEREGSLRTIQEVTVDSLADQMAKLHTTVTAHHPLIPTLDPETIFRTLWNRVFSLDHDELNRCFRKCRKQLKHLESRPSVMLHGCLDLDHVLLMNGKVRTILNWEHSAIGDPRWDVAYTSLALQQCGERNLANHFTARYVQQSEFNLHMLDLWEGLVALRWFALAEWLESMDERRFENVAGQESPLFEKKEMMRERALNEFG